MMSFFFFFNDTATTEIYTLSLHDALPISEIRTLFDSFFAPPEGPGLFDGHAPGRPRVVGVIAPHIDFHRGRSAYAWAYRDRKSTRLNSSHSQISYAVFCLKKKKTHQQQCC